MADLIPVAADVASGTGVTKNPSTFGANVTQGQAVYRDSANDGKLKLAQADAAGTAKVAGIAVNAGSDGQPADIHVKGPINLGVAVVAGTPYYLSAAAAGGIAPFADLLSTNQATFIGMAISATEIYVDIIAEGAVIP